MRELSEDREWVAKYFFTVWFQTIFLSLNQYLKFLWKLPIFGTSILFLQRQREWPREML